MIGFGTIGGRVAGLLLPTDDLELVGAVVRDLEKPREGAPPVFGDVDGLLETRPEVVVEAGGHQALRQHGPAVLRAGIDLVMVSVGVLAERETESAIRDAACEGGSHAIVASGAIGALDALSAAAIGGLASVEHVTRKPPRSLLPPEEADALDGPRELFNGSAREGALRFPESINVVAAVSLAGLGFDGTTVRVVADPSVTRNIQRVEARGAFGQLQFEIQNVPEPGNPRTGRIVAMSLLHILRMRRATFVVG